MAQEKINQLNISEKSERERLVIAKEVVIKTLVPVVFKDVEAEEREKVFDRWYQKLLALITGSGGAGSPYVSKDELEDVVNGLMQVLEEKEKKAEPRKKAQPKKNVSTDSITEKQMRKIWAVGRNLGYAKEDLEKKAGKGLSQLTKKEASRLISELLSEEDVEVLYG